MSYLLDQINEYKVIKNRLKGTNKITLEDLRELFNKCPIVEVKKIDNIVQPILNVPQNSPLLSPQARQILESVADDEERTQLEELFKKDNMELDEKMNNSDIDPDYLEKFANNQFGFFMEDYICAFGKCPLCGDSLMKYTDGAMPTVDLMCINSEYHLNNNQPYLYQVKISLGSNYFGKDFISVGSQKYGGSMHGLKGDDPIDNKRLLTSYICIKFEWDNKFKFAPKESFILIPNLLKTDSKHYYKYKEAQRIETRGMARRKQIIWNKDLVNTLTIDQLLTSDRLIPFNPLDYSFDYRILNNIYHPNNPKPLNLGNKKRPLDNPDDIDNQKQSRQTGGDYYYKMYKKYLERYHKTLKKCYNI